MSTDPARILGELRLLLGNVDEHRRRSTLRNPNGDGRDTERIRAVLERDLAHVNSPSGIRRTA